MNPSILKLDRSCDSPPPVAWQGMDVAWPNKKRNLGDTIEYTCPSKTLTWVDSLAGQCGMERTYKANLTHPILSTNCELYLA